CHGLGVLDRGLCTGFGILHRHFLVGLGFEFGLLNLLLFERQRVLHGVGLGLGLQDSHLRLAFGLLHLLGFSGFGFEFRDSYLLLLDFGLNSHLVVLLFFQKKALQPLCVFRRQLDIAQHDLFYDDAVGCQSLSNLVSGFLADFFAAGSKDIAHGVI